jgi:DNA-binding CsgD family transcriptional regulator
MIFAIPVFGFLASLSWRRFLDIFIPACFSVFLLSPSLLLLNHSQILFLILYTLNVTMIRTITVVFPFVIVDLYLKEERKEKKEKKWAWLAAALIQMIHTNAFIPMGIFKSLSIGDGYAVMLLTVAALVFFFLSRSAFLPKPLVIAADPKESTPHIDDTFKEHNLSEREMEIALLMAQEGLSDKEIGERLFISPLTVRVHVTHIYNKFGVKKRAEFMAKVLGK